MNLIKGSTWFSRFSRGIGICSEKFYKVIPARYVFAIVSCLGFFNVYAMRVNLHVAMVAMVGETPESHLYTDNFACKELITSTFDNHTLYSNTTTARHGTFDWDSTVQGYILAAFFFGYVVTQIPGGILAEKYSAKMVFGIGVFVTALFTLLTPVAARLGAEGLITVRVLEGIGEGVTFPAMHVLISRWVPKNERSRLATLIYNGSPIGTVVSLSVSGYLSSSDLYGGWPMVFYFFGTLGLIWLILWTALIYDSPEDHPGMSKAELQLIHCGLENGSRRNKAPTPWCEILTSVPVWTLAITHFGYNWGFYTLLTELPTYLSNILHFELKHNGVLSALPYLCQAIFAIIASGIADKMRSTNYYKITTIRKIMNSVAFFIPCVLVGCISYVGCDTHVIVALIVLAVAFSGFMYSGFNVTHVDMSPEYAGTLMGITNCLANMTGFLAPVYVGSIIQKGQTIENWSVVFLTTSIVYLITGLIFVFFASAELQPWGLSTPPSTSPKDKEALTDRKECPESNANP